MILIFGAGFYVTSSDSQLICAGCCYNHAESIIEAEALALLAALGCIFVADIQVDTIFIANTDLHSMIKTGNIQHNWRLCSLISSIKDYMSELGTAQLHIIPKSWMSPAASLALHGLNSHILTLFHHGRELPFLLMKQFNKSGIVF